MNADMVEKEDPTIVYQASRNRGTRTAALREKRMEDSEIMQVMGWKTSPMIGRYAGKIALRHLAEKMGIRP